MCNRLKTLQKHTMPTLALVMSYMMRLSNAHAHSQCGGELFFGLENDIFTHTPGSHTYDLCPDVCMQKSLIFITVLHSWFSPFVRRMQAPVSSVYTRS